MIVDVIIPALDEEEALPGVLAEIPRTIRRVVVVDNGSTDATAEVARRGGAVVVSEPRRGYGAACLAGLAELRADPPEAVVFLDGDHADDPREIDALVGPLARGEADLVIGSRTLGRREVGALTPQQRVGNALAVAMIRGLYGARFTDLGPFRAVTWRALERIAMADRDYGWTAEMQVKAVKRGLKVIEVPVDYYRRRAGVSKVASTVRGTIGAGYKIITTILKYSIGR